MTTTKQYDYLNRLIAISSQPSGTGVPPVSFNYAYNPANQRTQDKLADGSYWVYGYDSLGQVTNGIKHFYDGTLVPGQQFDYSFDTIGNRMQTEAGGDANGANLRLANYSVNNLNQITSRDYPGTNDIIGVAPASNSVTINGQTAWHKWEYFWRNSQDEQHGVGVGEHDCVRRQTYWQLVHAPDEGAIWLRPRWQSDQRRALGLHLGCGEPLDWHDGQHGGWPAVPTGVCLRCQREADTEDRDERHRR